MDILTLYFNLECYNSLHYLCKDILIFLDVVFQFKFHNGKNLFRCNFFFARHAQDVREHYEHKLERANRLYIELTYCMLQLEKREQELMRLVELGNLYFFINGIKCNVLVNMHFNI